MAAYSASPGAAEAAGFAEFITPVLLGYARTEVPDGHRSHKKVQQINENEVQTVRLMYYMLLNGSKQKDHVLLFWPKFLKPHGFHTSPNADLTGQ